MSALRSLLPLLGLLTSFAFAARAEEAKKNYRVEILLYNVEKDFSSLTLRQIQPDGSILMSDEGKLGDTKLELTEEGVLWDGEKTPKDPEIRLIAEPTVTVRAGETAAVQIGATVKGPTVDPKLKTDPATQFEVTVNPTGAQGGYDINLRFTVVEGEVTSSMESKSSFFFPVSRWTWLNSPPKDGKFLLLFYRCTEEPASAKS